MGNEVLNPSTLSAPAGFSHGIVATGGRLLFMAGQTGSDLSGRIIAPGNLVSQFDHTLKNLAALVKAAGGGMQDIVKLNLFVRSRNDYIDKLRQIGKVYRAYFGNHYPAMALFEIGGLFQNDALIEIEGIAVLPDKAPAKKAKARKVPKTKAKAKKRKRR